MPKTVSFLTTLIIVLLAGISIARADAPLSYQYISPVPGAKLVTPETTIAVRHGAVLDGASVSVVLFDVTGSSTGPHMGRALLADDGETVIFVPDRPFAPGETVHAILNAGLRTQAGQALPSLSFRLRHFSANTGGP